MRAKPVCSVDQYESAIWFADVPREPECYTPAWGETKGGQEEIWLGIKKVLFTAPPPLPNKLLPWVNEQDIKKSSDFPKLKEHIQLPESEATVLELKDCPEITDLWEEYLDDKWLGWAEENDRLTKIQEVYSKLHSMYQLQKTLGESFELIIGFGLLNWQTPANSQIQRPLIVAQASIELDIKRGTLFVKQGVDGAKLALEEDMLKEISDRCKPDIYQKIQDQLIEIGDDIWNVSAIETALKSWAYSVSAKSVHSNALEPHQGFPTDIHVTFAPILILRKRNTRSLLRTLEIINGQIDKIESDSDIPFNVRRSVKIVEDKEIGDEQNSFSKEFNETYFPLPSNDEQRKIVHELRNRQGVVVQGPPGTGKSHTIANLISTLLAEGKRILVTSQTPRALKVLKNKIPGEIAALCVNQLGRDKEALDELERSAKGINERKQEFNAEGNKRTVEKLLHQLDELRRRKADLERQLREIRERETYEHRIFDGVYCGTAQKIAERIALEQQTFCWLNVTISDGKPVPLSNQEMIEYLNLCRKFQPQLVSEIQKVP
ncbi:MAG: AAA domain-containing protein [Sedimentisphaerales bacterium]|nr:AAA domain-containing protein [Sedimentisphaerales bacterium]